MLWWYFIHSLVITHSIDSPRNMKETKVFVYHFWGQKASWFHKLYLHLQMALSSLGLNEHAEVPSSHTRHCSLSHCSVKY